MARNGRRAQALEALAFERAREDALRVQVAEIVLEHEGPRIDERAFAQMREADVALVRDALGEADDVAGDDDDPELETFGAGDDDEGWPDVEIARLEGEIEQCRVRQRAIESYVEALGIEVIPGE